MIKIKTQIVGLISLLSLSSLANIVVPVEVYKTVGSNWTKEAITEKMNEANIIMNECGLDLKVVNSLKAIDSKNDDGSVSLLADHTPQFRADEIELNNNLGAASNQGVIRVIFVGKVNNLSNVLGVSRRHELHAGEVYENSTYITDQLGTSNVDQTIAHELGHILLNEGHYHIDPTPNIMHYQDTLQNRSFDFLQCKKMRNSPLL